MTDSEMFSVVFVCTGNRFRSPLAERLFERFAAGLPIEASSFGTLEIGSRAALPLAIAEGRRLGIDLSSHRSRSLAGADLSAHDLIVGFERMHVAKAVVEAGAPRARTFTLPEIVGLLERVTPRPRGSVVEDARQMVADVGAATAGRPLRLPGVEDPIGRSDAVARSVADQVHGLTAELATRLFSLEPERTLLDDLGVPNDGDAGPQQDLEVEPG